MEFSVSNHTKFLIPSLESMLRVFSWKATKLNCSPLVKIHWMLIGSGSVFTSHWNQTTKSYMSCLCDQFMVTTNFALAGFWHKQRAAIFNKTLSPIGNTRYHKTTPTIVSFLFCKKMYDMGQSKGNFKNCKKVLHQCYAFGFGRNVMPQKSNAYILTNTYSNLYELNYMV